MEHNAIWDGAELIGDGLLSGLDLRWWRPTIDPKDWYFLVKFMDEKGWDFFIKHDVRNYDHLHRKVGFLKMTERDGKFIPAGRMRSERISTLDQMFIATVKAAILALESEE